MKPSIPRVVIRRVGSRLRSRASFSGTTDTIVTLDPREPRALSWQQNTYCTAMVTVFD